MITPDRLMQYAKRIISKSSIKEEESRSAISRAYYSLYHQGLAIATKKYSLSLIKKIERSKKRRLKWYEKIQLNSLDPKFLRKCNFHQILPDTLIDINQPTLAISFKNFRDQRNQADYDLKRTVAQDDAKTIVNNIDALIGQIKSVK